ncbi:helix-turn-helix transcriptional regulator [Thiohalobacter thiocyanaticus]|nr:AlpA family transcriptional regulator [Thiohalobacter thiocyanaticus]
MPAVMERTGLTKPTIYHLIKVGGFPEPVKLGPRCVGWSAEAVDEWIEQRISGTDRCANNGGN